MVSLRSSSCLIPDPVSPGLFLPRSRPWHLTTAAEGGLDPAPASRFRGAFPHRINSYTRSALVSFSCSWRTITVQPDITQNRVARPECLRKRAKPNTAVTRSISLRQQEFGIRIARGSGKTALVRLVVRPSLRPSQPPCPRAPPPPSTPCKHSVPIRNSPWIGSASSSPDSPLLPDLGLNSHTNPANFCPRLIIETHGSQQL